MSVLGKRLVGLASHGSPPKKTRLAGDVESLKFIVHDFKSRYQNAYIESPALLAHGYSWTIQVNPAIRLHQSRFKHVHCRVVCEGVFDLDFNPTVAMRCKGFEVVKEYSQENRLSVARTVRRDQFVENYLEEDGSLVLEVDIRINTENGVMWYPKEVSRQDLLAKLYEDASSESSDVVFSVGENLYRAHKNILHLQCKKLYEIANECDDERPIPIPSVEHGIFKSILDYVYTVKTPEIKDKDTAIELLIAADRFECVNLKLLVEFVIADRFLEADNAAALLLFADSRSCALLKEAAIKLFRSDPETMKQSEAWPGIRKSNELLEEMLDSLARKPVGDGRCEMDQMDVNALRLELEKADLELDGSREVLLNRLKIHRQG